MLNMGVLITDIYSEIMQLSNYFTTETNIEETTRQKIAQILNHMIVSPIFINIFKNTSRLSTTRLVVFDCSTEKLRFRHFAILMPNFHSIKSISTRDKCKTV
jgi:hypothetical protein